HAALCSGNRCGWSLDLSSENIQRDPDEAKCCVDRSIRSSREGIQRVQRSCGREVRRGRGSKPPVRYSGSRDHRSEDEEDEDGYSCESERSVDLCSVLRFTVTFVEQGARVQSRLP